MSVAWLQSFNLLCLPSTSREASHKAGSMTQSSWSVCPWPPRRSRLQKIRSSRRQSSFASRTVCTTTIGASTLPSDRSELCPVSPQEVEYPACEFASGVQIVSRPPDQICIQNRRFLPSSRADGAQPGHRFSRNSVAEPRPKVSADRRLNSRTPIPQPIYQRAHGPRAVRHLGLKIKRRCPRRCAAGAQVRTVRPGSSQSFCRSTSRRLSH